MPKQAVHLNLSTGLLEFTPPLVESSEVNTAPSAGGIPRADINGQIAEGWIPPGVRTINIQEADGVPALTNIATLVVGNGDLVNLGGGLVRLRTAADAAGGGGGGSALTVQTVDSATVVADVVTIVVPNGSLSDNGAGEVSLALSGGGGVSLAALRAYKVPTPAPNGVATQFMLPTPAVNGSVLVFEKLAGATDYSLVGPDHVLAAAQAIDYATGAAVSVTPYASPSSMSALTDDYSGSYCGWNAYGADIDQQVWVRFDLTVARTVTSATITGWTSGGWSPPNHHRWEYSDDGATWATAYTGVGPTAQGQVTTHTWASVGPHRYWRLYVIDNHVNTGGYTTAIEELELIVAPGDSVTALTFATAPASTTTLLVLYEEYGASAGGVVSLPKAAAAATSLFLFENFI